MQTKTTRFWVGAFVAGLFCQGPAAQTQQPKFRARTDLLTIDVTVLDRNRRPVTGLTADDFILLEDGKPQVIVALDEISVQGPEQVGAEWMKAPPQDVAANRDDESRLFVLVIDDATLPADPYMVRRAREMAKAFIEGLGPTDLAAVVFTRDNRNAQDFTRDRARLLAAADRLSAGFLGGAGGRRGGSVGPTAMDSTYYLSSLKTLGRVAKHLEAVPMRRKIVAYLSIGVPVSPSEVAKITQAGDGAMVNGEVEHAMLASLRRTIDRAQRANVSIYGLDPAGLGGIAAAIRRGTIAISAREGPVLFADSLLTLANNTGGHAFVNTNDYKPGIAKLFEETKSYYLLGYTPSPPARPGDYRRVEVKVKKPGYEVTSRKGYFASRQVESEGAPLSGGLKAITGVLSDPGVPLRGIAAPLWQPDGSTVVAVTLALDRTAAGADAGDAVEIFTHLFDPEGRPRGNFEQTASLCAAAGWCELTSLIAAKPGRHAVRIGVKHVKSGQTGSVYLDVDVPDFAKRGLTVTGLMLEATPAWPRTTDDHVRALLPVLPTTRRQFATSDSATLFFRVHQRPGRAAKEVTRTLRITNGRDEVVSTVSETIPGAFVASGADQRVTLPISKLGPGQYLVSVELTARGEPALERQLSFTVR